MYRKSCFVLRRVSSGPISDTNRGISVLEKMAQKNFIKLCVKNDIKCAKTFKILTVAFGVSAMSNTQVKLWYKRFKEDENIEAVKKIILNNRRITITEFANNVGILFGLCQAIFKDVLGINHAAAKIVSKFLNFEQKLRRIEIA